MTFECYGCGKTMEWDTTKPTNRMSGRPFVFSTNLTVSAGRAPCILRAAPACRALQTSHIDRLNKRHNLDLASDKQSIPDLE